VEFDAQEAAKAGILHFDIEFDLKSDSILTGVGFEVGSARRWAAPIWRQNENPNVLRCLTCS
jgi:hypothetical protein